MKANDVKIGNVYMTKIGSSLVKVTVVSEAHRRSNQSGNSGPPRFNVMRADNGKHLPKPRTAASLHPVPVEETPAERAGRRLSKEHAAEGIFYGEDATDDVNLRDIIRMRYPKASETSVGFVAKAYRAAAIVNQR